MARVLLHPDVEKTLQSLPNDVEDRIRSKLADAGENPDVDLIGRIGMRNAKLGGVQGALQLAIVFVMVGLRL